MAFSNGQPLYGRALIFGTNVDVTDKIERPFILIAGS